MKALFYWQRLLLAIIAVSLTATCLNFAYEIHSSWIWAWLGVVPMLLYAYYGRYIESFVVIVLALAFGSINMTHMFSAFDSNIAWLFLLLTLIIFSLIVLLNKFILQKLPYWWTVFALPATWILGEYLIKILLGVGTIGNIAYSQVDFIPLIQIASITGIWGVSFIALLAANTIAFVFYLFHRPRHRFLCWLVPALIVLSVLGFGMSRISRPSLQARLRIGLVSLSRQQAAQADQQKLPIYFHLIHHVALRGAEVVVLPEKSLHVDGRTWRDFYQRLSAVAKKNHVYLLVGVVQQYPNYKQNTVWVLSQTGKMLGVYVKNHYLPGNAAPGYIAGKKILTLHEPSGVWGVVLCSDVDFQDVARRYSLKDTGVLFVLSQATSRLAYLDAESSVMRAVENNFAIVRVAPDGLMTLVDDKGEIHALNRGVSRQHAATVLGYVRLGTGRSVYAVLGDWFIYFCGLLMIFYLYLALFSKIRVKKLRRSANSYYN